MPIPFSCQFLQQTLVDGAFTRFPRDQVPEVANFLLTDAMNSSEALLQPVRVPGQIVIDHQVGALQVDAFPGGVGRYQDLHIGSMTKAFFNVAALDRGGCRHDMVTTASGRPITVFSLSVR